MPSHLYLHIPFCHRICPYCSFYKHTPGRTPLGAFVQSLLAEGQRHRDQLPSPLSTVYFGGGTPSLLSPKHLRDLLAGLGEWVDFSALREVTFEANPATFTPRTAALYRELGLTRISLGVQSFNAEELRLLGREHSPEQAVESVHILREEGGLEVNLDLMFSLPGQTRSTWETNLERALSLRPDHLSLYNLTYEEDTAFLDSLQAGDFVEDPKRDGELFRRSHECLTEAGYEHYETSNYALPGKRSAHNEGYWSGEPFLGLGPSAVSTIGRRRWKNVADTAAYLQHLSTLGHAMENIEDLSEEDLRTERIAMGLRTAGGIAHALVADQPEALTRLLNSGLATLSDERLRLTEEGALYVDQIALELL